jgi:hypothetical protein
LAVPRPAVVATDKPLDAQRTRVPDRSLDEFVSASAGDRSVDGDGNGDTGAEEPTDVDGDGHAEADPGLPTMRWSADGASCDACAATVRRRWRDGDAVVCADCKEW